MLIGQILAAPQWSGDGNTVGFQGRSETYDEYGVPHEDYGPPQVPHHDYGPPEVRVAPTTEQ